MRGKIQRNYLPILSGLIFLTIFSYVAVIVVGIDRLIYQDKKRAICKDNWERICPSVLTAKLFNYSTEYFRLVEDIRSNPAEQSQLRPKLKTYLRSMDDEASRILNSDNSLTGITIRTVRAAGEKIERETIISRHIPKPQLQRSFATRLLLPFQGEMTMSFGTDDKRIGEILISHTTPQDIVEIRTLTTWFRTLIAGVVLSLSVLCWLILRYLIMPVRTVIGCIDRSKEALPAILPNPRTLLEAAYDDLARGALLNAISNTLAEYMSVDRLTSREEIIAAIPDLVAPHFGFAAAYAVELDINQTPEISVRWSRSALGKQGDANFPQPTQRDWIALGRHLGLDAGQKVLDFRVNDGGKTRLYLAVPIASDREQGRVTLLAGTPCDPLTEQNLRWSRETLGRLADIVRSSLETLELQRDLIVREKSKANISLSSNLGHDLTNIVATSKLELDTIRRFLALSLEHQDRPDPAHRALLVESLQGLLNNTKFLQEIINIYRSFSYMHHPTYEMADLSAVVNEVVELFHTSLSRRIKLHRLYAPDMPPSYVEPRLIKLAVFNLVTNATDALRRRALHQGDFDAIIWVVTDYDSNTETVTISVRDNGYGIRNEHGNLASPDEIRAIFRAGFTTKRGEMSEGLGLSWVRQIVQDFHRGQVRARNLPDGGAEVALVFPRNQMTPNEQSANHTHKDDLEQRPSPSQAALG